MCFLCVRLFVFSCVIFFVCLCVRAFTDDVEDDAGYLDVAESDVKHPPAHLSAMPEGLSSQQV